MKKAGNKKNLPFTEWQRTNLWDGSFYELSLLYEPHFLNRKQRSDVLQSLWSNTPLLGVIDHREQYGQAWQKIDRLIVEQGKHYYGCLRIDDNQFIGCSSLFIDVKEGTQLLFSVPLAIIARVFRVNYPLTQKGNSWIPQINHLLAHIGANVYQEQPFTIAALGEEAGALSLQRIMTQVATDTELLVPGQVFQQRDVVPHGIVLAHDLWWTGGKKDA